MGNAQCSRHCAPSRHERALDEHQRARRDRRRSTSRLHQQRASWRLLWLAVVYIGNHPDPHHKGKHPELADKVIVPDVLVEAHSATLNLCFYTGDQFPAEYKGDIFAAFHGSWNRMKRTGYKVVRVPFDHSTGKARGE